MISINEDRIVRVDIITSNGSHIGNLYATVGGKLEHFNIQINITNEELAKTNVELVTNTYMEFMTRVNAICQENGWYFIK